MEKTALQSNTNDRMSSPVASIEEGKANKVDWSKRADRGYRKRRKAVVVAWDYRIFCGLTFPSELHQAECRTQEETRRR